MVINSEGMIKDSFQMMNVLNQTRRLYWGLDETEKSAQKVTENRKTAIKIAQTAENHAKFVNELKIYQA